MSVLITQADIDYVTSIGMTVQIDDVVITVPTDWDDGTKLSVNIANGIIVRIEIPSDPFGSNSVKPTLSLDSRSAIFDDNYYEGSLAAYQFIIELDVEQPNSKGVSDTYLVNSEYIRRIIKDKFIIGVGVDGTNDRDLSKYLLGLIAVPFPVNADFILTPNKPITLGKYATEYVGDALKGDILSVDVGSITTPKLYNNALDYQGKTAILHLPYTDSIVIDIDYVVGQTVSIRYDINLYDGFTVINISSTKLNEVVQTLYVDLDIKVPFANVNYSQPPTGDPYNISIGGDNGIRQAFIEVLSYDAVLADGFFTVPVTDEALINTVKGFMTIDNIDLVSKATRTEKAMIVKQLEDGVIIKTADIPVDPTDPTDPVDPPIETPPNVKSSVTINGVVEVGKTLTSTITDPNGVSAEVNYQWFDGTNIVGFASTYIVKTADVGKTIKLTVTFTDNDGYSEVATSANTVLVPTLPPVNTTSSVAITGTVKVGYILSAVITDPNGVPNTTSIDYEWYAGAEVVSTAPTCTIRAVDAEKQIYVKVTFTDNDGFAETATSAKTVTIPTPPPVEETLATITGIGKVGNTLTATATNSKPYNSVTYQWFLNGTLTALAQTYVIKTADIGKTITMKASFDLVAGGFNDVVLSSNSVIVNTTGSVAITGTNKVNNTLTAIITDADGVSTVNYAWTIDSVVVSTTSTYAVQEADATKLVILTVNYTDNNGYTETATAQTTIEDFSTNINLWVGADDLTTFERYRSASVQIIGDALRATSTHVTDTVGVQQKAIYAKTSLSNAVTYQISFDVVGNSQNLSIIYMEAASAKTLVADANIIVTNTKTNVTVNYTATNNTSIATFRIYATKTPIGNYFELSNMKMIAL